MKDGFIKLHRKLIDWEWFSDSKTFHVFMYLLLDANHADNNWRGTLVKRGQTVTGRIKISEATGLSQQNVRTCLDRLKSTNEIDIKPTNKFSIITICNYEEYQKKNDNANQQLTSNQPTTNQQLTTNKNEKNEKNEKKEPKTKTVALQLPEWVDPLAWDGFVEMRKKIKAPLTDRAMQLAIGKLEKMESPNDVLDQSTINGWKGLFELKADFTSQGNRVGPKTFQQIKTDATKQAMIDFVTEGDDDGFGENTIRQIDG